MKKINQTEVVKIRLYSADKNRLEEIAKKECRSFMDQVRFAIKEWLEKKK
jgi:predicted transcriptional regulator